MPSQWQSAPDCNYIGLFNDDSRAGTIYHLGFPFQEWSICGDKWLAQSFVREVVYYMAYSDLSALLLKLRKENNNRFCVDCYHTARALEEAANQSKEAIIEHAIRWGPCGSTTEGLLVRPESDNNGRGSYRLRKEGFVPFNRVRDSQTYRFGYFAKTKRGQK